MVAELLEELAELEDESSWLLEDFPFELDDKSSSLQEDTAELEEVSFWPFEAFVSELEDIPFKLDDKSSSLLEDTAELEEVSFWPFEVFASELEDIPFELDDKSSSLLEDTAELEEIFSSNEDDISTASRGLFFNDSSSPQATKIKKNKNNIFILILRPLSCSVVDWLIF